LVLASWLPDATSGFFKLDNVFEQYDNSVPEATLKAQAPEFFKTYSAPRGDQLTKDRCSFWANALLAAVLPSLGILLLGSLVGWIFNGFGRDSDP
jgi:hypothetical protein